MLKRSRNTIGAKTFPDAPSPTAIPAAITRRTPQKMESPIPARGPIREDFTALMELASKSFCSLFFFSMDATRPMMNVDKVMVVLK